MPLNLRGLFVSNSLMQKKIITIVGGTGFVGRYVVKLLARDPNTRIRIIARDVDSALHLKTAGNVGQIVLVSGDVTKPESLTGKLDHSFAVINLTGSILFEGGRQKFTAVHEKGAGHLCKTRKTGGCGAFCAVIGTGRRTGGGVALCGIQGKRGKSRKSGFPGRHHPSLQHYFRRGRSVLQ